MLHFVLALALAFVGAPEDRLLRIDPGGQAAAYSNPADGGFLDPLSDGFGFAENRDEHIPAPVPILFFAGSPSAITRPIAFGVIDPIERMGPRWTSAHIDPERHEGFFPSLAYGDPTTSIVRELPMIWICASGYHVPPGSVCCALLPRARVSMFAASPSEFHSKIPPEAPTGFDSAIPKENPSGHMVSSTVARASPGQFGPASPRMASYSEPSEFAPYHRFFSHRSNGTTRMYQRKEV